MVEVRTQQSLQQLPQEMTGRQKFRAARLKLVHENMNAAPIQVYAGSEDIHNLLKHPSGLRLRGAFGEATEWPHDTFTHRRIMDGTLSVKPVKNRPKHDPKLGVREAAALLRPKPEDVPPVQPLSAVVKDEPASSRQPSRQPPKPAAEPAAEPKPTP